MPKKGDNMKDRLRNSVAEKVSPPREKGKRKASQSDSPGTSDADFDKFSDEEKPPDKKKIRPIPTCKRCGIDLIREKDAPGPFLCLSCACPSQSQSQESYTDDISVD